MMTEQLKKLFPNASPDFLKANAGASDPLGAVRATEPEQDAVPALDQGPKARRSCQSRVCVIITIISCRRRVLDGDNLQAAYKGLRDAIAGFLELDDADPRLTWQYHQMRTAGDTGTLVMVEEKPWRRNVTGSP